MPEPALVSKAMNTRKFDFVLSDRRHSLDIPDDNTTAIALQDIITGKAYPVFHWMNGQVQTIIDIGAHCGVFSYFMATIFPEATILAFEPHYETRELLRKNCDGLSISIENYAVTADGGQRFLHDGECGSILASLKKGKHQKDSGDVVSCLSAEELPPADMLKIDTEGMEIEILESIKVSDYKYIYLEYHSEDDRLSMDELLIPTHQLYYSRGQMPDLGEVLYTRR